MKFSHRIPFSSKGLRNSKYLSGEWTVKRLSDEVTEEQAKHLAYIDNKERNNLNPIEEAEHFRMCQVEMGMNTRAIGEKYGLDQSSIVHKTSLMTLPIQIQNLMTCVIKNGLGERHGYEISKLCKPEELSKFFEQNRDYIVSSGKDPLELYNSELQYRQELQLKLANKVIESEWTVKRLSDEVAEEQDEHLSYVR